MLTPLGSSHRVGADGGVDGQLAEGDEQEEDEVEDDGDGEGEGTAGVLSPGDRQGHTDGGLTVQLPVTCGGQQRDGCNSGYIVNIGYILNNGYIVNIGYIINIGYIANIGYITNNIYIGCIILASDLNLSNGSVIIVCFYLKVAAVL